MWQNFLKVAARNFLREKFYSGVNILGLASGLICTLFIFLWVKDEVAKDSFHGGSENIFRIVSNLKLADGEVITWNITPGPLAEDIRENIPEVDLAVRTMPVGSQLFQYNDKTFSERGMYADPGFFHLFSFSILSGKPVLDSTDVSHISISRRLAEKLFGNSDPIGKTIKLNQETDYMIAAVFENPPSESSLQFDYILPFEVFRKNRGQNFNWNNYDHPLYVRLTDPSKAQQTIAKINQRRDEAQKAANAEDEIDFYIQPFSEAYLHGTFHNGYPSGGRIEYVRIFAVVAVFILFIACINFTNMATAKAVNRSKEVGVRKVVGADRKSLIAQFIGESMFMSCAAMVLSIGVVYMTLPLFNLLVGKSIAIELGQADFLLAIIAITLITGVFAGSYPAFFLSAYQPASVLKGTLSASAGGGALRKGLVIFQFTLTVILVASSIVIYNQIDFIMNKNLGYKKEEILSFVGSSRFLKEFDNFKNEALQFTSIRNISRANETLVQVNNQNSSVTWPGKPENSDLFFRTVVVDYNFLETMGLELTDGRYFDKQFNDTNNFVLSTRAVEVMGLNNPVGESISQWGLEGKVVGVVNDIHSRSMHETIDPVVFMCKPEWASKVVVAFEKSKARESIEHLETLHKKYSPGYPFAYTFLEDDFEKLYHNEKVTASLALGFTSMAIIISGLGLLGLAAYTSQRRRKEISIRRTMGASVSGIIAMISRDFARLNLIAIAIGCPIAWLMMEKFLEGYAYHTELSWQIFAATSIIVLAIGMVTVIYQVAKAAMANPVDALRNE